MDISTLQYILEHESNARKNARYLHLQRLSHGPDIRETLCHFARWTSDKMTSAVKILV